LTVLASENKNMFVVFCFGAITEGMLLSARVYVNSFFQKLERWKIWIQ